MPEYAAQTVPRISPIERTGHDQPRSRELYIDRLRSVMTAFVILHHTAITYGAPGGWYYNELKPSGTVSSLLLTFFVATNQAYFMGFFFLLAGYFTPPSMERKGYARFLSDRFLRLGLPLLAFMFILGPATSALITAYEGKGFWPTIEYLWNHAIFGNGPLWFAQALLMFTIGYCAWRAVAGAPLNQVKRTATPLPAGRWWLVSAIAVGAAALAIRQVVPTGVNIIGLQLGYFASYTFLFALGIAAWRHDWLRQFEWRQARAWIIGLIFTWPLLPLGIFVARALNGPGKSNFSGGLSWTAILYAMWEPLRRMEPDRRMATAVSLAHELSVCVLVMAQPSSLCGVHHSPADSRRHKSVASPMDCACTGEVLRHGRALMYCVLAVGRSSRSLARLETGCVAWFGSYRAGI